MLFVLKKYEIKAKNITSHDNVYKIFTPNSNYALKKVGTDPGKLLFFLSAMDYLWQRGFERMSRPLRNCEGALYTGVGSNLYFLTTWIEGNYVDFSKKTQFASAVDLLADMHRRGEGFEAPAECSSRNDIGRWPKKWQQRIMDLEKMAEISQGHKDEFDYVFHQIVDISLAEALQSLRGIEAADYTEYCRWQGALKPLCHRDFVYHNLIFNGKDTFLIDFEYCIQDSRVIDLARLIRTVGVNHPWEVETVLRIIHDYQEKYPLSLTEQKLLISVLLFPHDIWRMGYKWYFTGQKKKSLYHLLNQQVRFYQNKYQVLKKLEQGFLSH